MIQNWITLVNIRRLYYACLIAVPIHLAHVILFLLSRPGVARQAVWWRWGVTGSHLVMLLAAASMARMAYFLRRRTAPDRMMRFLPVAAAFLFLLLGTALTVFDQWVTTGITPFLTCCLAIAMTIYLRPRAALPLYGLILIAYYQAVGWTQHNPEVLLSIRVQGISAIGLACLLSFVLYRGNIQITEHQILIEEQNRQLAEMNERLAYLASNDHLTASLGIAALPVQAPGGHPFDTGYRQADKALYQAKQNGRNRVELSVSV